MERSTDLSQFKPLCRLLINIILFIVVAMQSILPVLGQTGSGSGSGTGKPEIEVVATDLFNPCGVAVQPKTGDVFVTESGRGRVLRFADNKRSVAVSGFETEIYGNNPGYKIGPLGIAFIDDETFLIGEGGRSAGKDRLLTFRVAEHEQQLPDARSSCVMAKPTGDVAIPEGNFYGVAIVGDDVFVTCHGDDTQGWIGKAKLNDGAVTEFQRFVKTAASGVHAPTGIAGDRNRLAVTMFGETNVRNDGAIIFMTPAGKISVVSRPGLNDIVAIAFHPNRQRYYTLDFSWMAPKAGRLTCFSSTQAGDKVEPICSLSHPTAMAFDSDGHLWVTEAGKSSQNESGSGRLLKITGLQ